MLVVLPTLLPYTESAILMQLTKLGILYVQEAMHKGRAFCGDITGVAAAFSAPLKAEVSKKYFPHGFELIVHRRCIGCFTCMRCRYYDE